MWNLKYISVIVLWLLSSVIVKAQHARFITEGVIEFERSTNIHALFNKRMKENTSNFMAQAYEQLKKSSPQFKKEKSFLHFSGNQTMFRPVEDESVPNPFYGEDPAFNQINTIFADFAGHTQIVQKKVYEQTFLVADSTRKINWKITEELRDIAGFSCRRANALIMDSIYVVAFYSDEITVSGGPESFSGLPGIILGIALPHENVSWFAKEVKDVPVDRKSMIPPAKGKKVDRAGLITTLTEVFKNWSNINAAQKPYLL